MSRPAERSAPATARAAPGPRSASTLVLRNAAWLGAGEVWTKGGLFLVSVLIARGLGPEKLGVFQVASGAGQVLVTLLLFGQIEPLVRETAKRPSHALDFRTASRRIQTRVALLAVPTAGAAALLVPDADLRWALLAFLAWSVLRAAAMTWSATWRGLDRMHEEVFARGLEIAADLVLVWAVAALDGPAWLLGVVMAAGAALAVGRLAARARLLDSGGAMPHDATQTATTATPTPQSATPTPEASTPAWAGGVAFFASEGTSFFALAVLFQALLKTDTFVMAGLGVAKDEIGRYAVAVIPVWGALALPQLLSFATLPTLSRLAAKRWRPAATLAAVAALGLSIGLAVALGLHLLREPIVDRLFGSEYEASKTLLARMAWALPGASTAMLTGFVLAAWGRQRTAVLVKALALGASLALNLLWIPTHGVAAAAEVAVLAHSVEGALLVALAAAAARDGSRTRDP